MALRASLVITGDASSATAALNQTGAAMAAAEAKSAALSKAYADADRSIKALAGAQSLAAQETADAKAAFAAGEVSVSEYNRRLLETKTALSLVSAQHQSAVAAIKTANSAIATAGVSSRAAAAGYTNLGRQAQDVAVQLQSGTNIGTILAQQGGQVADAVAQMGGRFSGLASFLAGPWGAAIIVGAGVLLNQFIPALFGAGDAADDAKRGSEELAKSVDDMGTFFDATTGKIKETNAALIQYAILSRQQKIDKARSEQEESRRAGNAALAQTTRNLSPVFVERGLGSQLVPTINDDVHDALAGGNRDAALRAIANSKSSNAAQAAEILQNRAAYALAARDIAKNEQQIADLISGHSTAASRSSAGGGGASGVSARTSGAAHAVSALNPSQFGDDTAAKIAKIVDQFADLPPAIARSNEALRQLDDIAAEVEKKKPPNYDALKASLAGAHDAIEAQPYQAPRRLS